jgi:glutathione S-transferase
MTYKLLIGQKSYSSWSLRGWLCFAPFDIPVSVTSTLIYSDSFKADVAAFGGEGSVPAVVTPAGGLLSDSLAIAWHLAEAFPEKRLLPEAQKDRLEAQSIIAEMHAGFTALRSACPMNLRNGWAGFAPSDAVLADVARIERIWGRALARSGGPFLYGGFTLADAFYAPVATRLLTYALPMSAPVAAYAAAIAAHPDVAGWRQDGLKEDAELAVYDMPLQKTPWPAPRN